MIQNILYGLTIGGILYITAIGLSLTFGTMRIVNFAHGFMYTMGAYFLAAILLLTKNNFLLSALSAALLVVPLGFIVERYVIRRLYGVSVDYAIIATYAITLIGVDIIKWIWGAAPISLQDPIGKFMDIFNVNIPVYRVVIIVTAIVIFVGLGFFFKKSMVGKIVVAGLEDREAVRSLGLDVNKYFAYIFILGSILAALGGVLYAPITSVHPYMGNAFLQLGFAVVIIGGLGNLNGTFFAALAMGIVMGITGRYWGPAADAIVFMIMAIVLIVRPQEIEG
jgi:branched-chain amino acid transport system permease protein